MSASTGGRNEETGLAGRGWDIVHRRTLAEDQSRNAWLQQYFERERQRKCRQCGGKLSGWNVSGCCSKQPCRDGDRRYRHQNGLCQNMGCSSFVLGSKSRCAFHRKQETTRQRQARKQRRIAK